MKSINFFLGSSVLILLSAIVFCSCPYGYKYDTGTLPNSPVNLESINSEFNDYNLSAPFIRDEFPLIFSSDRNSNGENMDFVYKLMALDFSKETGELDFYNETNNNLDVTINHNSIPSLLAKVNSNANEIGPYVKSYWWEIMNDLPGYTYGDSDADDFLILYASDNEGKYNIHYIHNRNEATVHAPLLSINSDENDAYPCFNNDYSKLYFCSDINGQFDIFSVDWDNSVLLEESLLDISPKTRQFIDVLNSEGADKCPFIDENILVFTSDRPGGFGGYDLYYSKRINNTWSNPVNFGEKINSSSDEYRPILRRQNEFSNDFLLFSSDRPGGKGGFDLYYAGVQFE